MNTLEKVQEIISLQIGVPAITPDTLFEGNPIFGPFDILEIFSSIEEEYNCQVTDADEFNNVNDIVNFIDNVSQNSTLNEPEVWF